MYTLCQFVLLILIKINLDEWHIVFNWNFWMSSFPLCIKCICPVSNCAKLHRSESWNFKPRVFPHPSLPPSSPTEMSVTIYTPQKKFCNSSLRGNISLVASSSYVNVVSLESLIIPLYNDVSFVMLMQSWNAQSFWICSKVKNEMLQNSLFSIVNSRLFWEWIEFEWCWCGDAWTSTHVYSHLHTWMKSVWNNVEPGNFKKFKMLVSFLVKN